MRVLGILLLTVVSLAMAVGSLVTTQGHREVLLSVVAATMDMPPLAEPTEEDADVRWFDDYFTIHPIDETTFAIGETRYYQRNFN